MAGNWLFSGRRWLDPADQDGITKLRLNYHNLCNLFPAFAAACPASRFIAAVADVADSWRRHAAVRISGIAGFMSIADFGPAAPPSDDACAPVVGESTTADCWPPDWGFQVSQRGWSRSLAAALPDLRSGRAYTANCADGCRGRIRSVQSRRQLP